MNVIINIIVIYFLIVVLSYPLLLSHSSTLFILLPVNSCNVLYELNFISAEVLHFYVLYSSSSLLLSSKLHYSLRIELDDCISRGVFISH